MPTKFQVKTAEGELDRDASFAKMAKSHQHLEKRLGDVGGRPGAPDDYVVTVPEALVGAFDPAEPQFQAFRAEAHDAGLTQSQMDFVMEKYFEVAPKLVQGAVSIDEKEAAQQAESTLRQAWKDPAEFDVNLGLADRAVAQLGADLGEPLVRAVRNNPAVIQFLARVGKQLGEDSVPEGIHAASSSPVAGLMASKAYTDPKHPEHAKVSAQVAAHFARQPGAGRPIE